MPTVHSLFVKPVKGEPMRAVETVRFVEREGIAGDPHSDATSTRPVLLTSRKTSAALGAEPGALRENICIDGLAVDDLPSGTVLRVGTGLLRLTYPCDPCGLLRRYTGINPSQAWGARGMLAVVVGAGEASRGDDVEDLGVRYPTLPVDWRQRAAWFLERLPADQTVTYGELARAVGQTPVAARALPGLLRGPSFAGLPTDRVIAAGDRPPGATPWPYWDVVYEENLESTPVVTAAG